jgi:mannose-6-phosphate isomerase-like protein (cupin superfamily)
MTTESNKTSFRRVVTQVVNGKAVVESDGPIQNYEFKNVPGYFHSLVWTNPSTPDLSKKQTFDKYPDSVVPGPGGTSLHVVTFPPGSVFASPSFNKEAARAESLDRLRGLADHFEQDDPGMHKTDTVDYSMVFDGEIWLELDDGKTVHLKKGDVVVQNGTRHAWRNKGSKPVTMLFFMNGAKS